VRYLLDTHTFLWWIDGSDQLSAKAIALLEDAENDICFSAASAWEIAIKAAQRRLGFTKDRSTVQRAVAEYGFTKLSISHDHALEVFNLPPIHKDPFDRLLIAQAIVEAAPLITSDQAIARYPLTTIW